MYNRLPRRWIEVWNVIASELDRKWVGGGTRLFPPPKVHHFLIPIPALSTSPTHPTPGLTLSTPSLCPQVGKLNSSLAQALLKHRICWLGMDNDSAILGFHRILSKEEIPMLLTTGYYYVFGF